jgi:threonine synthase
MVPVEGNTTDNAAALALELSERLGWYPLMTNSSINPFTMEGAKTAAYEIVDQLDRKSPDWMIIGLGGGQNLTGHWRGFRELRTMDQISSLPKMVAVQAEGCAPFVDAVKRGLKAEEISPWQNPKTIATGIADASPWEARIALEAIRGSGGTAVAVSDSDLLEMVRRAAKNEGIFAEPSGAAGLVAAAKLREQGVIDSSDVVVCEVTASGLKQLDEVARGVVLSKPIRADFGEFTDRYLSSKQAGTGPSASL